MHRNGGRSIHLRLHTLTEQSALLITLCIHVHVNIQTTQSVFTTCTEHSLDALGYDHSTILPWLPHQLLHKNLKNNFNGIQYRHKPQNPLMAGRKLHKTMEIHTYIWTYMFNNRSDTETGTHVHVHVM